MDGPVIAWISEMLPGDIVRIAFIGRGGIGSGGNADGKRMCEAVRGVLKEQRPAGLVVDLSAFDYQFGDWIGAVPLVGLRSLGIGRVCVVARGETWVALGTLWEVSRLGERVPLFAKLDEALRHLSRTANN